MGSDLTSDFLAASASADSTSLSGSQAVVENEPTHDPDTGANNGFAYQFSDFVLYGLYNGAFRQGPPDPTANLTVATSTSSSNFMPNWRFIQSSNSAITAKQVRDVSSPSGSNLRFTFASGAAADEAYLEQIVDIGGTRARSTGATVRAFVLLSGGGSTSFSMRLMLQYLTADYAPISNATELNTNITSANGHLIAAAAHASSGSSPSTQAKYLRIRLAANRNSGTAAGSIDVTDVRCDRAFAAVIFGERAQPSSYAGGYASQAQGVLYITPGEQTLGTSSPNISLNSSTDVITLDGNVTVTGTLSGSGGLSGTSFPGAPNSGDVFFRTDRGIQYYYDGTRWLSTTLYNQQSTDQVGSSLPYSATASNASRHGWPGTMGGSTDFYLVDCNLMFRVASGGSALSASHKWDVSVDQTDGGNITTFSINSGASSSGRSTTNSLNTLKTGPFFFESDYTKTGTPGNLIAYIQVTYRLVG